MTTLGKNRVDEMRFDALTRAWLAAGSRRGLLGLLIALPGLSSLAESVSADKVNGAGGRRKRRKKRHKHGKGHGRRKHKAKQKPCRPASRAKTCAGQCGAVRNTCKQTFDCGSCACEPPCGVCQTCQEEPTTPGTCVPDPAQEGEVCGPGQFCRDDGTCHCEVDSCAVCESCQEDGVCSLPCGGEGCCADGTCEPGNTLDTCGIDGESCQVCAEDELCWNGRCVCGDVCADGCQFATLREAVEVVEAGATLRLCAETYAGVSILKDLTVVGVGDGEDGTILRGQVGGPVVNTGYRVAVTLRGLRITGGAAMMAGQDGGGISIGGTTLELIDCTITGNRSADAGGGIYSNGGQITLTRCQITDNEAGFDGGGIFTAGHLTLENCVVSGNTAGDDGGGIFCRGFLNLINSEITDNAADMEGGGLSVGDSTTLTDCQVTDNRATTGGGIFHLNGTLSLENSQVTENTAESGGGIYNDDATVTLTDSTVEDNAPDNCAGTPVPGCSG